MRHVLDASVVVAALRRSEPSHAAALRHCLPVFAGAVDVVVPAIFDVEVAAALARRGAEPLRIAQFFRRHIRSRRLVTLGPRAAAAARDVAVAARLRAADAFYVWLAMRERIPLVTLDGEVRDRAGAICDVRLP
jgi:predicted nucleic acid-binding protein